MKKPFIYGVSVGGDNFTGRVEESRRLRAAFEHGLNSILISPRRMGKTSLVRKVIDEVRGGQLRVVYLDIYSCRSEMDFCERFAAAVVRQTAGRMEVAMQYVRDFLSRLSPRVAFSPEPLQDYSLSLTLSPATFDADELLALPQRIAERQGCHTVVCIDEFQQVGTWADTLGSQKRMRGIWQHQRDVSYCLFGSRQHMLTQLFQNPRMPFYQFGDIMHLPPIALADWVPFIQRHFASEGKSISPVFVQRICEAVGYNSSYVQQLSWNVLLNTEREVDEAVFQASLTDLVNQSEPLFVTQTEGLTAYQMNFLGALCEGVTTDLTSRETLSRFRLGSKSNIDRIRRTLLERDLIALTPSGIAIADPVLQLWLGRK